MRVFLILSVCTTLAACDSKPSATDGGPSPADANIADANIADAHTLDGHITDVAASSCAFPPSILEGFVAQRTLYVSPTGNDSDDGLTSATAWATLAHAAALEPGDEVRVAPG